MKITKILLSIFLIFVIILLTIPKSGAEDIAPQYEFVCETAGAEIYKPVWPEEQNEEQTTTSEYNTCSTQNTNEIDRDFLAKLLYAEAGSMTFEGQVWVCSAILNLCEYKDVSLWSAGHNRSMFSVASRVDGVVPNDTTYEVVDYVLNGNRIADVCYFRKYHYHRFGTPMMQIGNVYFSKP